MVSAVVLLAARPGGLVADAKRTLDRALGPLGNDNIVCRLFLDPHDKFTRVVPEPRAALSLDPGADASANLSNITVNYTGFTGANGAAARASFQAAVDIWKTQVASTVPIVVDAVFTDLCAANQLPPNCGLLGTAGSGAIANAAENPMAGTWYPLPLLNKIAGIDVGAKYGGSSNIEANFDSSRSNWYFGTDGFVPGGTVDFETVVLHELGHGLGFVGDADVSGGNGIIGSSGFPYIYDRSVVDGAGVSLVTGYINNSPALGTVLTGGGTAGSQTAGTFWNGAQGKSANGGLPAKLYAPSPFLPGSSHSHLDENKFPAGNINSLMTPILHSAEAIHTPGGIVLGIFADVGWGSNSGGSCSYALDRFTATVSAAGGTVPVTLSTGVGCAWTASATGGFVTIAPAASGTGSTAFTLTVAANTATGVRSSAVTIGGQVLAITQNGTGPAMTFDKASLIFAAVNNGAAFTAQSPAQIVRLVQSGAGAVTWTATPNVPWLLINGSATQITGSGSATFTITTRFASNLASTQSGTITFAFTGAGNIPGSITVTLNSLVAGAAPVGSFDTPADGSTGVTGSIAVTGWAMDDVGVVRVRIDRNPVNGEPAGLVPIGDATIVDGARPDVAALFPNSPQNTRAGWGYLMLTNFLPGLGNGTFTLHAIATDAEGHDTDLGTKTITCTNATAIAPFGAIDTPAQGGTASGTLTNFGWVLSRVGTGGAAVFANPVQGGTVRIAIDGALIAAVPGEWVPRTDLTALFPAAQFPGVDHALGLAGIDTTTMTNGVHTIAWAVTATNNQSAGVGSRYFTVSNGSLVLDPGGSSAKGPALLATPAVLEMTAADRRSITGRRGYDLGTPFRRFKASNGAITVQSEELDRIELRLGEGQRVTGYLRTPGGLAPLPIGSALDESTGVFTWQPGVGFVGAYDLAFVRWAGARAASRQDVRVVLNPKGSNQVGPQIVIDTPKAGEGAAHSFVVAGWAADLDSEIDGGVDTVHVWAYPAGGGDPIFIGAAAFGGARPDVAAIYGDRFGRSGYGIEVTGLPPGAYDVAVFAYSTVAGGFAPAKTVRVVVK